jgi:hypothetical protein
MVTEAQAVELDALAARIEGRTTGATELNQLMLRLIGPLIRELYGKAPPSRVAAYTTSDANPLTALALRIPDTPSVRWTFNYREFWHPNNKPFLVGVEKQIGIGNASGGTYAVGTRGAMACSAAVCRCWALRIREAL